MQCPDPATERWLEGHSVPYDGEVVAIDEISEDLSHRNQARISQPLNEETVLMYATAYVAGDVFPPPVLYRDAIGHLIVIDGNHRVAAMKLADKTHTDAYIVRDLGEAMIRILTFEANAKHGLPTSMEERVQQAQYLVALGVTIAEAARMLRIPERKVQNAAELDTATVRIRSITGKASKLPDSARRRLTHIRSDRVLAAAVQLAENAKLTTLEINDLVTRVNREKDDESQLLVVQREIGRRAARVAATGGGKIFMPEALILLERAMADVDRLDPDAIRKAFPNVGEGMKMVLLSKVMDAQRKLKEVLGA